MALPKFLAIITCVLFLGIGIAAVVKKNGHSSDVPEASGGRVEVPIISETRAVETRPVPIATPPAPKPTITLPIKSSGKEPISMSTESKSSSIRGNPSFPSYRPLHTKAALRGKRDVPHGFPIMPTTTRPRATSSLEASTGSRII